MLQRGRSGDGCELASALCKYDLGKGDLFVLSLARQTAISIGLWVKFDKMKLGLIKTLTFTSQKAEMLKRNLIHHHR